MPAKPPRPLAPCSPKHVIERGFTLVEILVVIVIIGITLGLATLAFGDFGQERKIIAAAESFADTLTHLHEQALLEASTFKLEANPRGYRVARCTNNHWQTLSQYRAQNFPTSMRLTFQKANHVIIIFDSSGSMTPFLLCFGSVQHPHLRAIQGESDGSILLKTTAC